MSQKRIVIIMDGGIIQNFFSEDNVEYVVLDLDVEGADPEDIDKMKINGKTVDCFGYCGTATKDDKFIDYVFKEVNKG